MTKNFEPSTIITQRLAAETRIFGELNALMTGNGPVHTKVIDAYHAMITALHSGIRDDMRMLTGSPFAGPYETPPHPAIRLKPLIYCAGAIGSGEARLANVERGIAEGESVLLVGGAPVIPHLCHYWAEHYPHEYEAWMEYDRELIKRCDAVYRFKSAPSPGTEREVVFSKEIALPVLWSIAEVADFVKGWAP